MPAPIGNEYYKLNENAGRDKEFSSPEEVIEIFNSYAEDCQSKCIIRKESHVKEGIINIEVPIPLTIEGFCHHAEICSDTFKNYEKKGGYEEFFVIFRRIRDAIFNQSYNLAAANVHNPGLVARKLGIADKKHLETPDGSMTPKINLEYKGKEIKLND